tara:strand:+ start:280 stop:855 length:576 start_codon:yes stop_codon:yes gene_type:complete
MFPIFGLTNVETGEPMLIGISGKAQSGKDTLGKFLCDEYKCLHYYFAKPLKEGAKVMFNLTDDQIANKEVPIEPWGISPRKIYQLLGTEVGRGIDPAIWIKNAEMFIKSVPGRTVVITDCRFDNEATFIRNRGGVVINIVRDHEDIDENRHSSEGGLEEKNIDFTIYNNGTIEDMCNEVVYGIQKANLVGC